MTPEVQGAFQADAYKYFAAIKVTFGFATLRLLDGSATLTVDGETYTGEDDTYGVLSALESFSDGIDEQAPTIRFALDVPTPAAAAALNAPEAQGATVEVRIGAIDIPTGLVIADPIRVYVGEVDVPTVQLGRQKRSVSFDCVSVFERLFDTDTGVRLSYAFHNSVFSGDQGLAFVVRILNHAPAGASYGGSAGGWTGGMGGGGPGIL